MLGLDLGSSFFTPALHADVLRHEGLSGARVAERILEMYGLRSLFRFVDGADVGIPKWQQIERLLGQGVIELEHGQAVAVGGGALEPLAIEAQVHAGEDLLGLIAAAGKQGGP